MYKNNYIGGQKIGNLIFINRVPCKEGDKRNRQLANFKCQCGKEFITRIESAKNFRTNSCGCLTSKLVSEAGTIHGHAIKGIKSPEYTSWQAMIRRCTNPKHQNYERYKQLNVKVCDRWLNSFQNFLEDMGKKPSKEYSIDRIDNNGNYEPENCRWATPKEQQRNTRNTIYIEYNGIRDSLNNWSDKIGIPLPILYRRIIKLKWSIYDAFTKSCGVLISKL